MIDVSVADVGKAMVTGLDECKGDMLQEFILTLEWAMSHGYVNSFYTPESIRKMIDESEQEVDPSLFAWEIEGANKEDVAWLGDVDSMFIIDGDIVPWVNENLPMGFFATYSPETGVVLNKKED